MSNDENPHSTNHHHHGSEGKNERSIGTFFWDSIDMEIERNKRPFRSRNPAPSEAEKMGKEVFGFDS